MTSQMNTKQLPDTALSLLAGKNILITGGAGNLGSAVINRLSFIDCNITALDIEGATLRPFDGTFAKVTLEAGDIRERNIWERYLNQVDVVFHFAAQTSAKKADEDPAMDVEINLKPVVSLVQTCVHKDIHPSIIFAGTVTQVGVTKDATPVNESELDDPVTVYDENKLAAEKYLQQYVLQYQGRAVILRLANLYGPGPKSSSADRGILNQMVRRAMKGEDLTIYGDGEFVRDYVYIDDVVSAFLLAAAHIDKTTGNFYLIGTGQGNSFKRMVHLVRDQVKSKTGSEAEVKHIDPPKDLSAIEYRNFVADTKAFHKATGWKARVDLSEGISRTVDYFIKG